MYTVGRLVEEARRIADDASSTWFLDILLQSAEETLADFYSQEWPFATGEGSVATVAPYDTGTITLTNGSASVTGSGTTWDTAWPTPAILRPADDSGEPLVVLSFDSTTGLTLDRTYPHATPSSPVTYTLEFPCYPISEYIAVSGVMIAQSAWHAPLVIESLQSILYNRMWWTPGSYPCEFFLIPGDGTTSAKLVLNPAPSQIETIRFRYTRAVPDFRCYVGSGTGTGEGGLATLAAGGTALTATGATFQKMGYSLVGHYFEAADQTDIYSLVSAVGSDTGATVATWGGTALTSASFYISPKILMPDHFRPMLRDLMRWKTFQNAGEIERASVAEIRYRRNYSLTWRRVNRLRQDRDVKPISLGGFGRPLVEPPAMPWQLVMEYSP